jgi:major cell surface glycoprotein (TIGR04216 family)
VTTETTDRAAGDYEETGFELSGDEVRTQAARDILAQPGVYRYGVIDGIDTDIIQLVQPGRRILGQDGLDEADFNQGSSTQVSLRVVEPSLEGQFRTFDGSVYEPDGLDVRGTLVGPREYLTFLTDDRGNSRVNEFSADEDDGSIDEDDVDVSGLTEGTIQASILSPGRDTQFGDGSFRIPQIDDVRNEEFADASLNNFIDFAEDLSETTRTQEQVREILLDQTIRQSGSDDLIVTEEFRLTDDSRTAINDIVPDELRDNLTGVNTIEVGETMVVRGVTNRNPDDATIIVEAEQGPSTAELGTGIADEWAADGEEGDAPGGVWSTELEVDEEVEPGEYVIRSDDGDRIDEATVEIVAEGTLEEGARLQDEAAELQQRVQELEGQIETLEGERDELESQVSDLESQNSDLESQVSDLESQLEEAQQTDQNETDTGDQEEEGQPGFTALAALVALIAVALLALRRREEDE